MNDKTRCLWATSALYIEYHDNEWGTPLHDERKHFEFLILEGFQAGLSWSTILNKRNNFRAAFDNFDPQIIATYDTCKLEELLSNVGIIRNRSKIEAAVTNARLFLNTQKEFGSYDKYIWSFVNHRPIINHRRSMEEVPVTTAQAKALSVDLTRRGFKFVGPTICYALMQATGMVNDHLIDCFRHSELNNVSDPI